MSGLTTEKQKTDKLEYEKKYAILGKKAVAGVDEVGRGPLAGPVVCCAVIMPLDDLIEGVDDSKKLSEKKREALYDVIREKAVAYSIAELSNEVIDKINILEATKLCMKNAIESLAVPPDFVLVDGNMTLDVSCGQESIIKGDFKSYTIGCASILAKVYRDRLMVKMAEKYPEYGFEKHKGYGTKAHIDAIKEHGICPIHRKTFTKNF